MPCQQVHSCTRISLPRPTWATPVPWIRPRRRAPRARCGVLSGRVVGLFRLRPAAACRTVAWSRADTRPSHDMCSHGTQPAPSVYKDTCPHRLSPGTPPSGTPHNPLLLSELDTAKGGSRRLSPRRFAVAGDGLRPPRLDVAGDITGGRQDRTLPASTGHPAHLSLGLSGALRPQSEAIAHCHSLHAPSPLP